MTRFLLALALTAITLAAIEFFASRPVRLADSPEMTAIAIDLDRVIHSACPIP